MQKVIQDTLAEQLGLPIKRHDVIETHGWPGCNSKQEFGYRLHAYQEGLCSDGFMC
jgi:hypothetical protein